MSTLDAETASILAAARTIQAIADKLAVLSEPPEIHWGDDDFGARMREAYEAAPVEQCRQTQQDLAKRVSAIAEAVRRTSRDYGAQEQQNVVQLWRVAVRV